jgi:putative intracellular protease/amidase
MIPHDTNLNIGSLLFEGIDQIDLTGPFEVLSRIPNSTYRIYGKTTAPVRDLKGLRLTPDATLAEAPPLDVLHVPGGFGQQALMEDVEVLNWIKQQAAGACSIFSVCTGALLCGAAGLLKGRRATTHWASFHLLPFFGAIAAFYESDNLLTLTLIRTTPIQGTNRGKKWGGVLLIGQVRTGYRCRKTPSQWVMASHPIPQIVRENLPRDLRDSYSHVA